MAYSPGAIVPALPRGIWRLYQKRPYLILWASFSHRSGRACNDLARFIRNTLNDTHAPCHAGTHTRQHTHHPEYSLAALGACVHTNPLQSGGLIMV